MVVSAGVKWTFCVYIKRSNNRNWPILDELRTNILSLTGGKASLAGLVGTERLRQVRLFCFFLSALESQHEDCGGPFIPLAKTIR